MTDHEAEASDREPNAGADQTMQPRVVHEEDRRRWILVLGDERIGTLTYQLAGGRFVLIATHVVEAHRHHGLASLMVGRALDEIRAAGRRITVICPFVGDYIANHPDYADLVDAIHPGSGASGSNVAATAATPAAASHDPATPASSVADPSSAAGTTTDRILVLGAVAYRGPLSADGIASVLDDWGIGRWTSISAGAIDLQLRSLVAAELIRPDQSVPVEYHCTEEGRTELRRLLLDLLNAEDFTPFNLMPLLHFVTTLGVAELADGLRRRVLRIDEILAHERDVIAHTTAGAPEHPAELARLNWHRFDADREWSLGFIARLYGATTADAPRP